MFDHLSLGVGDIERSIAFYDAALAPLFVRRCVRFGGLAAYGPDNRPMFWLGLCAGAGPGEGVHFALAAPSRAAVDGFYAAALGAGGIDDGPPGLRPHYHPNYYAAFVRDPDGHRIEAVCHLPG